MPRTTDKKERLISAAKALIHAQGFGATSLSDIAQASDVPLGNVYYYFRSKDQLASAVIEALQAELQPVLEQCATLASPKQRLLQLLDFLQNEWLDPVTRHGCPIGGLCQELNKSDSPVRNEAAALLSGLLQWLEGQFAEMGHNDARSLALHFVSMSQGASLVASTLQEKSVLRHQLDQLKAWVESL